MTAEARGIGDRQRRVLRALGYWDETGPRSGHLGFTARELGELIADEDHLRWWVPGEHTNLIRSSLRRLETRRLVRRVPQTCDWLPTRWALTYRGREAYDLVRGGFI